MKAVYYRRGYKYQTSRVFEIETGILGMLPLETDWLFLSPEGLLTIRKGYAWDGASGPTIDTKSTFRGSLTHDALYQLMRLELLDRSWRDHADELLRKLCIEDGMWSFRANYWWVFVDKLAGAACRPSAEPQEEVAP